MIIAASAPIRPPHFLIMNEPEVNISPSPRAPEGRVNTETG